jgi:hypothetical protein
LSIGPVWSPKSSVDQHWDVSGHVLGDVSGDAPPPATRYHDLAMAEQANRSEDLPLGELLDDPGKAWLEDVVDAFNAGGYEQAVEVFLADEAAIQRAPEA